MAGRGVRRAAPADAPRMAELAEEKRSRYADHAFGFQRPAADARAVHEPFLAALSERQGFLALVHESGDGVDGFVVVQVGAAPPPFGRGDHFHVDDFAVDGPERWRDGGAALLREAARLAGAADAIVVCGPPELDPPKSRFLRESGMGVVAEWRVRALDPADGEPGEQSGFEAVVGPAPPVYDPGGPVCLALSLEADAVDRFERFARRSGAVLAVAPVLLGAPLREELDRRGYVVASDWYRCAASALLSL